MSSQSLNMDLMILAQTVVRVVRRDGISAIHSATMPEFLGDADNQPAHEQRRD